ncbi:MAG: winged helix-turn-helix domain-containing protein, partial [Eggerthellaceae bacterium]
FDLVILDLMLPRVPGERVCRAIRDNSDVPIIMLTAKGEVEDRIIGLELGADDYLVKPFSPRELVARARALLRRVHADSEPQREVLEFGELTIDVSGHKVLVNNEEIDLTASEFKLLTTLSRYPGRVYSRMELVEKVLGYDFEGYERTIDSHVKNLRAKIGDNPQPKVAARVHGVGYRLRIPRKLQNRRARRWNRLRAASMRETASHPVVERLTSSRYKHHGPMSCRTRRRQKRRSIVWLGQPTYTTRHGVLHHDHDRACNIGVIVRGAALPDGATSVYKLADHGGQIRSTRRARSTTSASRRFRLCSEANGGASDSTTKPAAMYDSTIPPSENGNDMPGRTAVEDNRFPPEQRPAGHRHHHHPTRRGSVRMVYGSEALLSQTDENL